MSGGVARIAPAEVIQQVEMYVDKELRETRQYDNHEPFDDSGVWSLHQLAAEIYAAGWRDGERAEGERARYQRARDRNQQGQE